MGFFDKLKNMVTGGGAKVEVEAVKPSLHSPFPVKIKVVVEEADLEIAGAYLKVAGVEKVELKNFKVSSGDGEQPAQHRDINETAFTYEARIEAAGAQKLVARGGYEWEVTVELPADSQPAYAGVNASHSWKILGGLDVTGNDPDSGWITIAPQ